MVVCRDLLSLKCFENISLLAGHSGLDREVTWPYSKHTKGITPWVKGGEFVLVSGYELGVNEDELLNLIDEAVMNRLSGLLIEGGVNFKTLSDAVIKRADEAGIPLFFAPRVISFLDVSRDISTFIMEGQLAENYSGSLLKEILSSNNANIKDIRLLFEKHNVPYDCQYQIVSFSVWKSTAEDGNAVSLPLASEQKKLRIICEDALRRASLCVISYNCENSVSFMIYGNSDAILSTILEQLAKVRKQFSNLCPEYHAIMASSAVTDNLCKITECFSQSQYVCSLLRKGLFSRTSLSFCEIGSYQFLFYIEDKSVLLRFRDYHLKALHICDQSKKNSQLLDTLRMYLNCGGNVLNTAKLLYIHRNTLQYRLNRIESITGKKLTDPETRQDFENAFIILNIYPF